MCACEVSSEFLSPSSPSIAGSREVLLTAEQLQIVNYSIQPREVIKVMAFAGETLVFCWSVLH